MYKKLGILGGMGPLATYTLYKNIIESTPVQKDQDHIDMTILNASHIPDRTAGILHGGESPLPYLLSELKILENAGCDLIAIPCNTSHYYYDELQKNCNVRILNMVDLTAEKLEKDGIKKIFLMATAGTIKTGVYQKYFSKRNIEIIPPTGDEIEVMMKVIYDIKAFGIKALTDKKNYNLDALCYIQDKYAPPVFLGMGKTKNNIKTVFGCTEFSTIKEAKHIYEYELFSRDADKLEKLNQINRLCLSVDAMEVLKDKILELFGVRQKI